MTYTSRSWPRAVRLGIPGLAAVLTTAAWPAAASAASIALGPSAPAGGTEIAFSDTTATTPIDFSADTAGCSNPHVGVVVTQGPRQQPGANEVPVVGTAGTAIATWTVPRRRETYTWQLALRCDNTPPGQPQALSEARTITLLPPAVHARLRGVFVVRMFVGIRRVAKFPTRFTPIPSRPGTWRSRDSGRDAWVYNKRTRSYRFRGRYRDTCEARARTVRRGSIVTVTIVLQVRRTDIVRGRRFAKKLVGTAVLVSRPTARGRAAGCRAIRGRLRVIAIRRGRVTA
jgi:hypothetical protein